MINYELSNNIIKFDEEFLGKLDYCLTREEKYKVLIEYRKIIWNEGWIAGLQNYPELIEDINDDLIEKHPEIKRYLK